MARIFQSDDFGPANSSTSALSGSATFTGAAELNFAPDVGVSCKTDADGTLYFDFSNDGTNWDTFPVNGFTVKANVHEFHTAVKLARYFRVRLVNGSGAQSFLRLYTYYGIFRQGNAPLNQTIANDADAIIVRSIDTIADLSLGRVSGFAPVNKFGRAPDGGQITSTDVWDRADAAPTQQIWLAPTAARIHTLVSGLAGDTLTSGAGAWTVRVWYLPDWDTPETFEDVNMNGTSGVAMSNAAVMINRMRVIACGSSGPNVGTITATAATDGTITAVIRPSVGSTEMAIYGWPSTQTLLLTKFHGDVLDSSGAASDTRFRLFHNPDPENYPALYVEVNVRGTQSDGGSSADWPYNPYLPLSGPGILKVNVIASAADTDVSGGFDGILVDAA